MSDKNKGDDNHKADDKSKKVSKKKNDKLSNGEMKETQFSLRHFLNSNRLPNNRNNIPMAGDYPAILPDFVQDHIGESSAAADVAAATAAAVEKLYGSPYTTPCRPNASESPYHATDEAKINHSLPDFLPLYVPKRQSNNSLNGSCTLYPGTSFVNPNSSPDFRLLHEQELIRNDYLQRKSENDQQQIIALTDDLKRCEKSLKIKHNQLNEASAEIKGLREEVQRLYERLNSDALANPQYRPAETPPLLLGMVTQADNLVHNLSNVIKQMRTCIPLENKPNNNDTDKGYNRVKEMVSDTQSGSDSSSGSISPPLRSRRSPHSPFSEQSFDNGDDDKSNLSAVSIGSATNSPQSKNNCKQMNEDATEIKVNNLVDDLSDVSDSDNDDSQLSKYDLDGEENSNASIKDENEIQDDINICKKFQEKVSKLEDAEEQLDFEAEDADNIDINEIPTGTSLDTNAKNNNVEESEKKNDSNNEGGELEEGEVSDDDEARPEEVEPKPVCKFYSRGLCTWGMSCRFLHPGVMDKGNYTMFDIIRPAVPDVATKSDERIAVGSNSVTGTGASVETAWERGLRTAKEMVKRANKRKEQDSDFEEKKMTLTRSPEDTDKENGFYNRNSPDPPVAPIRHYPPIRTNLPPLPVPVHDYLPPPPPSRYTHDYYNRRFYFDDRPESDIIISRERGGIRTYREVPVRLPPHPAYYSKYNDELAIENALKRHGGPGNRSKREVILQRVDPSVTVKNRAYDYQDSWVARNKSPIKGRFIKSGHRKDSYSSASSYSSSSSSSRSSSGSSRSSYGKSRSKSLSPSRIRPSRRQKSPSPLPPPPVPQSQAKRNNRKYTSPQQPQQSSSSSSISARKAEIGRDSPMGQPNSRKPYKSIKPPSPQHPPHRSSSNVLSKVDFDDSNRNRAGDRKKANPSTRNTTTAVTNVALVTNTTTAVKSSAARKRASSRSSTASESSSSSSSTGSESSGSSSSSGRRKSPRNATTSLRNKRKLHSKRDRRLSETKKAQSPPLKSMSPPPLQLNLKRSIKLNLKPPKAKSPTPPSTQPPPSHQKKLLIIPDFCMPDEPESKSDSGKKTLQDTNESLVGKKRPISSISSLASSVKDTDGLISDVKSSSNKAKASRREELLKQLKAVEDAIAKKRSKLS